MIGHRLVGNLKAQLGQKPNMTEKELAEWAKKILQQIRQEYRRMADALASEKRETWSTILEGREGLIRDPYVLTLTRLYNSLLESEENSDADIEAFLPNFEIWNNWLRHVKGVGPIMGAVLISEVDPVIAENPSKLHKFAGLDVVNEVDGRGRSKRKEHLIEITYTNRKGQEATRLGITYNAFFKTKMYVLAGSFLRIKEGHYRKIYLDAKNRYENHERYGVATEKGNTDAHPFGTPVDHRHKMALRKMIKQFLDDFLFAYREQLGLPNRPTYAQSFLAKAPHSGVSADLQRLAKGRLENGEMTEEELAKVGGFDDDLDLTPEERAEYSRLADEAIAKAQRDAATGENDADSTT